MLEIVVLDILRARDTFLYKAVCPNCSSIELTGVHAYSCNSCTFSLSKDKLVFDLSKAFKRNITAVADKHRRNRLISKKIVKALYSMQEGLCAYCSTSLADKPYHVDHVLPLAAGGTNNLDNLCLSCAPCNLTASSKAFIDMAAKRSYILYKRFKLS